MNHQNLTRISVIGAGSWGTTLANLLAEKGHQTVLYVYEADQYQLMIKNRINQMEFQVPAKASFYRHRNLGGLSADRLQSAIPLRLPHHRQFPYPDSFWQGTFQLPAVRVPLPFQE